jgi:hypothetical protein
MSSTCTYSSARRIGYCPGLTAHLAVSSAGCSAETSLHIAALADLLAIRNPGDCLQILETGDTHGPAPGLALYQTPGTGRRTWRKLTPDYTIGCKRVILSSTLYPALGRSNVTLHSREQGIAALDETGIIMQDGQHIDVDLIVWSTGYDATDG